MIKEIMTNDHRECDSGFENIEFFISNNKKSEALILFNNWVKKNLIHFDIEENIIFPKLSEKLGMDIPPVKMMLLEHAQIKNLIKEMDISLRTDDIETFLGLADSCFMLIQQHNMKEEQILYTLIDNSLSDSSDLLVHIRERVK